MKRITVARALKLKNELAGEVKELASLISQHNSHAEDTTVKFEVGQLFLDLLTAQAKLVSVKTAIQKANGNIAFQLVSLVEDKGLVSIIKNIDTTEGKKWENEGYRSEGRLVNHVVTFDAIWKRNIVKDLEKEIRDLQDEIDTYNAQTLVEVPD